MRLMSLIIPRVEPRASSSGHEPRCTIDQHGEPAMRDDGIPRVVGRWYIPGW